MTNLFAPYYFTFPISSFAAGTKTNIGHECL